GQSPTRVATFFRPAFRRAAVGSTAGRALLLPTFFVAQCLRRTWSSIACGWWKPILLGGGSGVAGARGCVGWVKSALKPNDQSNGIPADFTHPTQSRLEEPIQRGMRKHLWVL